MRDSKEPRYPNTSSSILLTKTLLESEAWNSLTKTQRDVFSFLYLCLQWNNTGNKKNPVWVTLNNGNVNPTMSVMMKKLRIASGETISKAIHKLVEVGFSRITETGYNRVAHRYKILYRCVPRKEERWRRYPKENWKHEIPRMSKKNDFGRKTQFQELRKKGLLPVKGKAKHYPNKIERKMDNPPNELERNGVRDTIK